MTSSVVCPSCQQLKSCNDTWPADVPLPDIAGGLICEDCRESVARYAVLVDNNMLTPVVDDEQVPQ